MSLLPMLTMWAIVLLDEHPEYFNHAKICIVIFSFQLKFEQEEILRRRFIRTRINSILRDGMQERTHFLLVR
ncbi:hypothetical protein NC651_008497 [Populus alba x Populus x berolinensis]|nr:hypothetical protein NC651_008497 [Populus alba x Populus x berolinensis]